MAFGGVALADIEKEFSRRLTLLDFLLVTVMFFVGKLSEWLFETRCSIPHRRDALLCEFFYKICRARGISTRNLLWLIRIVVWIGIGLWLLMCTPKLK